MLTLTDITKTYRMGEVDVHALRGISFTIEDGEFAAIVGPSGSGKSTLMNIIGCLDAPSAGSYTLDGAETSTLPDEQLARVRARRLGFVFQQYMLLARQSALRNVEMPMIYRGVPAALRRSRAETALTMVGMRDRMGHLPRELSGGQQQRVAIARALAGSPSLILADEPTGALDSRTGEEILTIFRTLNREQGLTVIIVTHDREIAEHCDRVLTVKDGLLLSDTRGAAKRAGSMARGRCR